MVGRVGVGWISADADESVDSPCCYRFEKGSQRTLWIAGSDYRRFGKPDSTIGVAKCAIDGEHERLRPGIEPRTSDDNAAAAMRCQIACNCC